MQAMLHRLGQPQEEDECLLHEQHEDCFLELGMTLDGEYVTINSSTKTSSEVSLALQFVVLHEEMSGTGLSVSSLTTSV